MSRRYIEMESGEVLLFDDGLSYFCAAKQAVKNTLCTRLHKLKLPDSLFSFDPFFHSLVYRMFISSYRNHIFLLHQLQSNRKKITDSTSAYLFQILWPDGKFFLKLEITGGGSDEMDDFHSFQATPRASRRNAQSSSFELQLEATRKASFVKKVLFSKYLSCKMMSCIYLSLLSV